MLKRLRSTSVQLAIGYALLFVASSLLLVGLLWWRTVGYLEQETAAVIRALGRVAACSRSCRPVSRSTYSAGSGW